MSISQLPYIPENITVHLGPPDSDAPNVTVPFIYYIKNVASSEIYPTWPQSALTANIYAIITFTLNRIFTEWYRSKGYDFDITSTTAFDQKYTENGEVFVNIGNTVDQIFNSYVRKQGTIGPYFTSFCDGVTAQCDGLSQWGTVDLASQGKNSVEILQHYYGDDIEIVSNVPVSRNIISYPGNPLRRGDIGNDVATIEIQINRISDNYPAIPKIDVDGIFGALTEEAVKKFQQIFNMPVTGIVDKSTWYRINYIFDSVKQLGELTSEGVQYEELNRPFRIDLKIGDSGVEVRAAQYFLNLIGNVYQGIIPTEVTGTFTEQTDKSVKQFQTYFGIAPTGIVDLETARKIDQVYKDIIVNMPPETAAQYPNLYPGYVLSLGLSNDKVVQLQTYLNEISSVFDFVPRVAVTGTFDEQTANAIRIIQERYGIPVTGGVGPITWYQTVRLHREALGQVT